MDPNSYLFLFRNNLILNNSDEIFRPDENKMPYSPKPPMIGFISFNEFIVNFTSKQIIKYNNSRGSTFILKRRTFPCESEILSEIMKIKKLAEFIESGLKEYIIALTLSIHPCGINVFDFQLTYNYNQKILISEMFMEDGGQPLDKCLNIIQNDRILVYKTIFSIIEILSYMETRNIAHGDIKLSSFLINDKSEIKIINFDKSINLDPLGKNKITNKDRKINKLHGFTKKYVSPETKYYFDNLEEKIYFNDIPIDPIKSDIYSLGIVLLEICKCFPNFDPIIIDTFKLSESKNKLITTLVKKIDLSIFISSEEIENNPELLQQNEKINFVLSTIIFSFLNYKPKLRMSFQAAHNLLKKISQIDENNIIEKIKETKPIFNETKEELELNLNDLQIRNQFLIKKEEIEEKKHQIVKRKLEKYQTKLNSSKVPQSNKDNNGNNAFSKISQNPDTYFQSTSTLNYSSCSTNYSSGIKNSTNTSQVHDTITLNIGKDDLNLLSSSINNSSLQAKKIPATFTSDIVSIYSIPDDISIILNKGEKNKSKIN